MYIMTGCLKYKLVMVLLCLCGLAQAQLNKTISLNINQQRLDNVLEIISNKGGFYFSYNSNSLPKDSLVSVNVKNKPVQEVLQQLLPYHYEFKESGNYIIIRRAPIRVTVITNKAVSVDKTYTVSGFVYDEQSGMAITEASVYEKDWLVSSLTNNSGYFKLRLKSSKASLATLTISKEFYEDTSVQIQPKHNQELTITMVPVTYANSQVIISPEDYINRDTSKYETVAVAPSLRINNFLGDTNKVEKTFIGRTFLSAKQKIQTLNLNKFFTTRPFQVSLVPGLGSHGKMGAQVVNNFSLNLFGGYTAGTNGIEIGGVFNVDKKDVRYFQAAGVTNVVGGNVKGFQVAGVNNTVLKDVNAFQTAGVGNFVKGNFNGLQIAGVYNHVSDTVRGIQISGVGNFSKQKIKGIQFAGVANFSNKEIAGGQIAGVINYTKKLKGFQFGVINIADTSEGVSIGLLNIIINGYHKLAISTNEVTNLNAALKTGSHKFYSILQAGFQTKANEKIFSFGYGFGSEINLNKKKTLSFNPELVSSYLYLGTWDYLNLLNRLQLNFNVKAGKYFSFYAGPCYAVFITDQTTGVTGYRFPVPTQSYAVHNFSNRVKGWIGFNAGIHLF